MKIGKYPNEPDTCLEAKYGKIKITVANVWLQAKKKPFFD
jgi:hypothetical protein